MAGEGVIKKFETEDGLGLCYKVWHSHDTAPCVIYLHGLESNLGWFSNLAIFLNDNGINVYAFDRRGSGLNKDSLKDSGSNILSDLKLFIGLVRKEHPDSKIFLIGLCLGGKIAVSLFSSSPGLVDGLILISPSLKTRLHFSIPDKLSILFMPDRNFKVPIEDGMFTSNKKFLEYISRDPGRLRHATGRYLLEIANMDRTIKKASHNIKLPVLLLLAGIDEIIDTARVRKWFEELPSMDKTIKVYKDYRHILTFEEKADEVMKDIADWIWMRAYVKSIAS